MSIDWLWELERAIDSGKIIYACPSVGRNQWIIGRPLDELRKAAKRSVENRKIACNIVRLIPKSDAIAGNLFLVPVVIGEPGSRGEPQIQWSTVETKDAAEMMRDVRHGPAPFFGMQVEETVDAPTPGS